MENKGSGQWLKRGSEGQRKIRAGEIEVGADEVNGAAKIKRAEAQAVRGR